MSKPADVLLTNASVLTFDVNQPHADTVAVSENIISFVGTKADSEPWRGPNTQVIDCQQTTLMPGIIDSHFHLYAGSKTAGGVDLRGIKDMTEVRRRLLEYAAKNTDISWLTAHAAAYSLPDPETPLHRTHLDEIASDRPLVLFAHDLHALWLNTRALEQTHLLHGSDNPELRANMTFGSNGLATGELVEGAVFAFVNHYMPSDEAFMTQAVKRSLEQLASFGITSVHNMLGDDVQGRLYQGLEQAGDLTCRVYLPYYVDSSINAATLTTEATALRDTYASNLLRIGAVKFFADGVYDGKTALTLEGYPNEPDNVGTSIFEREHYLELVARADSLGFQVATHAVGDGAVRLALDAYEQARDKNGPRNSRHRVEHIEVINPSDIPRFAELGVIASMQPLHAPASPTTADLWFKHIDKARWQDAFAVRRLRDTGAHIVLGSDWSVVTMNPFVSWQAAVTRRPWGNEGDAHFQQNLVEVMAGYTKDAAYAEFQEAHKGQLKVGMLADIALLSEDVISLPTEDLGSLTVKLTMIDGKIVYAA
ncbi:MAG: amidohydrolase [Deinococcota bacterium]